ncbi:MAG: hypothetical protein IJN71_06060 [Oscillospiraceae bacterium]|nr:hypothetical protein [Oscillospiraceae bacterium]
MKDRSKVLLAATALATIYVVYLISYFFGATASADGTDAVAGAIATALVMPHMIMFLIGAIFGWIGVLARKSWAALVGAILYSVGTLFFLAYVMFGAPILILGFVGYSKQKKINNATI